MDRFELDMCTYLNAHSAGELRDVDQIIDRWATDKSVGHISLLLATLAAGAHYSDIDHPQRLELATDFGKLPSRYSSFMATAHYTSPEIISCSSTRQLLVPAIPRRCPSTFDSG